MKDKKSVCFIGIYENTQNQPLRQAITESEHFDLTEAQKEECYLDDAAEEHRLPVILFRSYLIWGDKRFPKWLTPALIFLYVIYHFSILLPSLVRRANTLRKSDVLVVPHLGDVSFFAVYPISVLFDTPIVYINHSGIYSAIVENRGMYAESTISAKLLKYMEATIHSRSDRVVVLSHAAKQKYQEMYGTAESTYEVAYVSVEPSYLDVKPTSEFLHQCDVLYWGGFHTHHGVETMLEAAKSLPDVDFTFIGSQDEQDKKLFRQNAAENVRAPGFAEAEKLISHIHNADIILGPLGDNPVAEYVIGTKTAEAAYFRKAVVVGDQPAVNEVFTHRETAFLCRPGDAEDVASGIEELLADDELRAHLEEDVYDCYADYFSPNAVQGMYYDVFAAMLLDSSGG